jgi:DNA replication licensing factor MCM5
MSAEGIYFGSGEGLVDDLNNQIPTTQDGVTHEESPENFPRSLIEAKDLFKKFVKEFKQGQSFTYLEQLASNWSQKKYFLEVFIQHLDADCPLVGHALRRRPLKYMGPCEAALQDLYVELGDLESLADVLAQEDAANAAASGSNTAAAPSTALDATGMRKDKPRFQLILKSDEVPRLIRELESSNLERLVCIPAIVIQASLPDQKAYSVRVKCKKCMHSKDLPIRAAGKSKAIIPRTCENDVGGQDGCGLDPYIQIPEECKYYDVQYLKVQELPEDVPTGETPRTLPVVCTRFLSGRVIAGQRLHLIGVYTAEDRSNDPKASREGGAAVKSSYLQVLGIVMSTNNSKGSSVAINPAEEEKFVRMAKQSDIRDMIYKSIAPSIKGSNKDCIGDIKSAIACLLFGGSRKHLSDGTKLRGDINVLLIGDPGTAKSQFLKYVERAAPIAVYTSGKGSSAAGLTASVVRDQSGRFALEGGAMVLADGGVVCIDEFDKMRPDDRVAIHETMEQQTISISKAGITTILNTRTAVLAAANPMFGSWNSLEETADQMDFATTILSRFDLIFLVKDIRDFERDKAIATHILGLHAGAASAHNADSDAPIPVAELRKYINFCKTRCDPRLSEGASSFLQNHYIKIRNDMREERESGKKSVVPITVRQLEALGRISEALARMELSNDVTEAHAEEAIRLFTLSTMDAANKQVSGATLNEEDRKIVYAVEDAIRRLIHIKGRKKKSGLFRELESTDYGFPNHFIHHAVRTMILRGELEEVGDNAIVRSR